MIFDSSVSRVLNFLLFYGWHECMSECTWWHYGILNTLGLCHLAVKLYCLPLILLFETMSARTERRKAEPWKQLCTAGICWGNGTCDCESCRACQGWQQLADLWRYSSWRHSDTGIALWHFDLGITLCLCVYVPAVRDDIQIQVSASVCVFMYLLCVIFRYRYRTLCI